MNSIGLTCLFIVHEKIQDTGSTRGSHTGHQYRSICDYDQNGIKSSRSF